MNSIIQFQEEVSERIIKQASTESLKKATESFLFETIKSGYSYNFSWMDRPIIQYPQDMVAMQEIIWKVKPDLIIECGIAHGGSLIFSASLLALIDYSKAVEARQILDPEKSKSRVLGIDIDIRKHNKEAINNHPMAHKIDMIEGSSTSAEIVQQVRNYAKGFNNILVCLDSNHTHNHVLDELNAYADLVSINSYCIVFDTVVEDLNPELIVDRSWGKGNNPKTAVYEFLQKNKNFEIDKSIDNKLLLSVAPDGYLKRHS